MVLIISISNDYSTSEVISWFIKKDVKFLRVNKGELEKIVFVNNSFQLFIKGESYSLNEFKFIWYRKGDLFPNYLKENTEMNSFLFQENKNLKEYFYYLLHKIPHLNSYEKGDINKLIVLDKAKEVGLKTPNFFITSEKEDFQKIKSKQKTELITKTISGNPSFSTALKRYVMYTKKVETITDDRFFPSLFQQYIKKKYELRIFYLGGVFFSMAIFPKSHSSMIDIRNEKEASNRNMPYKLPKKIEEKIIKLMKSLDLESGSIDMLVTEEEHYYFLEVNPVGQFGYVAEPCNYNINEMIANYIIERAKT